MAPKSIEAGNVQRALASARLFALDVDGTLTDGRVVYAGSQELQSFDVRDGQGLVWVRRAGVELAWITGRGCSATEKRAEELGVRELACRSGPKAEVLEAIQSRLGVSPDETIAMGDDLPDLAMRERSALFLTPADAHPVVREHADVVTSLPAGRGAVREVCEAILRAKDKWEETLQRYLLEGDSQAT